MVKTAIILAAGMGTRLLERTKNQPKGFLKIGEKSIVEQSICKLIEVGIEKIVIGTGYLDEAYKNLTKQYPQIICVHNDKYMKTGSMYTLYNLKNHISDEILLLESDLLYEKKALEIAMKHKELDVILVSELTSSNDEVFIESKKNHALVNMSKDRNELNHIDGELVGITKISYSTFQAMCDFAEARFYEHPKLDYENALVGISNHINLYVHKLCDFVWCEIDNENHLFRATHYIYPIIQIKEKNMQPVKRNILLNPGPATTTDTVKYAQVVPDICPREDEFGKVMEFISLELTKFVANPEIYVSVLFGGSGTAVIESILSSVIGDEAIFIVNNGEYGKRMCQIATAYGLNYIEYRSEPDKALDLVSMEATIALSTNKISHLAVVHNETTTGLLNNIEAIGHLCKKHQIQMIVDAMSSFGAIPIDMEAMNISYLASSSNKNLQGMAGVGFVIARKDHLELTKHLNPRNFYLHLYSQYKYFSETMQMRFTPPVQTLYALKQAIIETRMEDIQKRYERYSEIWEALIKGITKLGLTHLVKKEHHSRIITAIIEPSIPQYDFEAMHRYFYDQGYTIYPGKLEGQNNFRVANIGDITRKDIDFFIKLLEQYLISIGYSTERKEIYGDSKA